jgi:hypothetical protein
MRLLLSKSLQLPNARITRPAFSADGSMASRGALAVRGSRHRHLHARAGYDIVKCPPAAERRRWTAVEK